jgi:hypothetical protein
MRWPQIDLGAQDLNDKSRKQGRGDHKERAPAPKKKRKRGIVEERNGDHNQRGGNTHRNERDVHTWGKPTTKWVCIA